MARLSRYEEYLGALENKDPSLVLSLAASQLNHPGARDRPRCRCVGLPGARTPASGAAGAEGDRLAVAAVGNGQQQADLAACWECPADNDRAAAPKPRMDPPLTAGPGVVGRTIRGGGSRRGTAGTAGVRGR
jgi:hypothetical protein